MPLLQPLFTGVIDERTLARLFDRSKGVKWGLARASFAEALWRSVTSRFGSSGANVEEIEIYLDSLHLEDLALAAACAEGQVTAWAYFIECFRPALRKAAWAIAGEQDGSDLADGLYAELYGLEERDGRRRSLFHYFHGRSRLSTWLRAILSQRRIDAVRERQRLVPLDDDGGLPASAGMPSAPADPDRAHFAELAHRALASAVANLDARDRLRLASYYLQHLTLAQIGRLVGEHEATVSRKLDRLRRELRRQVEAILRDQFKLSRDQIGACIDCALDDSRVDVAQALHGANPERGPTSSTAPGQGVSPRPEGGAHHRV